MARQSQSISLPEMPEDFARCWNVSRESQAKLNQYATELLRWQATHNLISPGTIPEIWTRHIADGLQLADLIQPGTRHVLDIGSGGGLPAIPLAIVLEERWPSEVLITMVESNTKKCAFLRHVSRLCELNTRIANKRIESVTDSDVERPIDVLTARALAPVATLLDLVEKIPVRPQRMLFLKGQHVDVELTEATKCWNISFSKHPSKLSADGCILDISEAERVNPTALHC
jgi:16S rRNA (guanine527-N7)-methyltransferase